MLHLLTRFMSSCLHTVRRLPRWLQMRREHLRWQGLWYLWQLWLEMHVVYLFMRFRHVRLTRLMRF